MPGTFFPKILRTFREPRGCAQERVFWPACSITSRLAGPGFITHRRTRAVDLLLEVAHRWTLASSPGVTYTKAQISSDGAHVIARAFVTDREKRKQLVWAIEKKLIEDGARPVINQNVANTCMAPAVKGVVLQVNSIYNNWRFDDVWLDR